MVLILLTCDMKWYKFSFRQPKRWSRRAKSDKSTDPKTNRVKLWKTSRWFRLHLQISGSAWFLGMVMPFVLLQIYIALNDYGLLWIFGLSSTANSGMLALKMLMITLGVSMLFMSVGMFIFFLGRKNEKRRAIGHRCHLCPRCAYILQSRTDDSQPCPECGQRISRREAVRLWARFCAR